jgi:hypothetical protein
LVLDDDWVRDALGLYAHLSPVVGCRLASFLQWIRTQITISKFEIIGIIEKIIEIIAT